MKRFTLLLLFSAVLSFVAQSQPFNNGIGIHFSGLDFYGSQTGTYFFESKFNKAEGKTQKRLMWEPAVRGSYWHALNEHFDLGAGVSVSAMQYPVSDKDSFYIETKLGTSLFKNELPYVAADVKVNYNILPKVTYVVSPYVSAGLSAAMRESNFGIDLPIGVGANAYLGRGIFLNWESNYRAALTSKDQNHLTHSLGVVYWWKCNKKVKPVEVKSPEPVMIKDQDNDGIADADDSCPTMPGKKEMHGCPDRDNDGVIDSEDLCPDVKGTKQLHGCPDTDGDGIIDEKDKCPTVPGIAKYDGCPIPDSDHDGFNDEVDKCPNVASSTNMGCPEVKEEVKKKVEMAAKGVNFESGSAVISKASFDDLNKIVDILKSEPTYVVAIDGHTDNSGKPEMNLELSQKRADACKKYLVDKGVETSRITSTGFGDTRPIGDNNTQEGRAKNRRTEFNIKSY